MTTNFTTTDFSTYELDLITLEDLHAAVTNYRFRVKCSETVARDKVYALYTELSGKTLPRFFGHHTDSELPFQKGETVTIPKGTKIRTTGPESHKVAGRTYQVKVHHTLCGMTQHYGWDRRDGRMRSENPSIVWAGAGGYWHEVDINDILEANGK